VQVSEYIRSLRMGSNAAIRPPWMKVEQSMPRKEHSEKSLVPEGSPQERFPDELAKWLAGVMSRRQALRWFGGTLASAMLARFAGPASAVQQTTQGGVAAGGTSIPTKHGASLRGIELVKKDRSLEGRFGLMFKKLPAFEPPDELLNGLAATMAEVGAANNPEILAGFTFLGQFIDHDLTLDTTPLSQQQQDPDALTNFRSARYDLDSVYGGSPTERPELYDPNDPDKLLIDGLDDPNKPDDVPRQSDGKAIIGDPRNDENLIVCQLHVAFMKFHNALVDHVREQGGVAADGVFEEAQRLCRWHFQWMVVHDFLPHVVGQDMVDQVLEERDSAPAKVKLAFYKPKNTDMPMMPVEFAVAAYRFGHSMIRGAYRVNDTNVPAIFGAEPNDTNLNGSRPIPPALEIVWKFFFAIPGLDPPDPQDPPPNQARLIDSKLSGPLFTLPSSVVPPPDVLVSLAQRNLLRGKRLGLPSGQRIAREMRVAALSNQQLGLGNESGWKLQAPLWFYILKEAELQQGGVRLAAVGGRIVAEVFLGLLNLDENSYLSNDPSFRPAPPIAREDGQFLMGDLLKFAGVRLE
jgi:hypothetical protein